MSFKKWIWIVLFTMVPPMILVGEIDPLGDDDGDGLTNQQEYEIWLTNPQDSDTDGDGWTDFQETQLFDPNVDPGYFNPLVADMPKIDIILKSEPQISMEFTSSSGSSETFSTERSSEFGRTHSRSGSTSRTTGQENSYTSEFSTTVEANVSLTDFGVSGSATATNSNTSSFYSEDSYTFGSEETKENREIASQGRSYTQDSSTTQSGGEINYSVAFINPTGIAYEVESMTLATYKMNPRIPGGIEMIGALSQETAFHTFQNFSIGPNTETPVMSFENGGLFVGDVLSLLEDSSGIKVVISGYKLTMDGRRFDSQNTMVAAKTARINLDFDGFEGLYPESYQVSVKTLFNPDYRSSRDMFDRVTLEDILSYLYIDPARSSGNVREYNYYESDEGLENLRGIGSSEVSHWVISHTGKRRGREFSDYYSTEISSYQLNEIEVMAGDIVDIFYVMDKDQDGLTLRNERILGSSDETAHSDDDGIDDFKEFLVGSSPVLEDTDNDGYRDDVDPAPVVAEELGEFSTNVLLKWDSRIAEHSQIGNRFLREDGIVMMIENWESKKFIVKVARDFSSILELHEVVTREEVSYSDFIPVEGGYLLSGTLPMIQGGMAEDYHPGYIACYNEEGDRIWSVISNDSEDWSRIRDNNRSPIALAEAENGNFYMLTRESSLGVWEISPQGEFLQFYKAADIFSRSEASMALTHIGRLGASYEGNGFFFAEYNGSPLLVFNDDLFLFDGEYATHRDLGQYWGEGSQAYPLITADDQLFIVLSFGMDGGSCSSLLFDENLSVVWRQNRGIPGVGIPWVWEENGQFKAVFSGNMMDGMGSLSDNLYLATINGGQVDTFEELDWKRNPYYFNHSRYFNMATMGYMGNTPHGGYLFSNRYFFYYTDNLGNMPLR